MGALDKRIFSGVAIVSALLFVVAAVMLLANGGEVVDDANDIALYIVTVAGIMAVVYAVALMMDRSSFVRTMSGVLTAIAGIMFLAVPFVGESTGMLLAAASIVAAIAIVADMLALWVSRIYGAMYVAAVLAAVDLAMGVLYFAGSPQITYHAITFIAFGVWLALSAYVTGFVKVESAVKTREVKEDKQSNKASKPQAKNTKATKKAKKPEKRPEEKPKTAEVPNDEAKETPKEEPKAAEPKKEEAPKEEPKSEPVIEQTAVREAPEPVVEEQPVVIEQEPEDVAVEEPIVETIEEPEEAPIEDTPEPEEHESEESAVEDVVAEAVIEQEIQPEAEVIAEEPITEAIDEPEEAPVEEPVMRESEMPSENVAEAPEQIVEPEAPQQSSEQIQSSGEMDVESGAVTESGEEVLGEDLYTDYSPEAVVRRAAWNKGLRCRRGYGPYNIPVAFVKGKVAVFVDDGDADTSIDSKLREEGWTVLRYDSSTITDGKAQGEEIAAAVKSNLRSAKAASKKKSKK